MNDLRKRFPVYSVLLALYPASYRQAYEDVMLQTVADMLDATSSRSERLKIWLVIIIDLPIAIARQQIVYAGGIMQETPHFVKRNSILAALLLLPFFAALLANRVDSIVYKQNLYHTWVWQSPIVGLWVLYFPLLALLIASLSFGIFVGKPSRGGSWLRRVFDVQRVWTLIIPAVVALGILFVLAFHDSIQCWVQTPGHIVTHISQSWQCSERNQTDMLTFFRRSIGL